MKQRGYVAKFAERVQSSAPALLLDVLGIGGCALIIYGACLTFAPLGYVVAGVMLLAGVWHVAGRS